MKTPTAIQTVSVNRLLERLPAAERKRVEAQAEDVDLVAGSILCEAGKRMSHVYFPHHGVVALFADGEPGERVHLALLGEEGMLGLPVAIGASVSSLHAVVHGVGRAAQIDATAFFALLKRCPALRHLLLVYSHTLIAQIAQAAVCHAMHPVSSRFARWLLTASDRLHSLTVSATQEQIAATLGVLRLSIGNVASELQDAGLIHYQRGVIRIDDRARLKARACACYGITAKIFRDALE